MWPLDGYCAPRLAWPVLHIVCMWLCLACVLFLGIWAKPWGAEHGPGTRGNHRGRVVCAGELSRGLRYYRADCAARFHVSANSVAKRHVGFPWLTRAFCDCATHVAVCSKFW
jgi:hypothetical protein